MSLEEKKAILIIKNYLNKEELTDEFVLEKYQLAVTQLIKNSTMLESIKTNGIISMSEGNQSITFKDAVEPWTITEDVKLLLPTPYIRMW